MKDFPKITEELAVLQNEGRWEEGIERTEHLLKHCAAELDPGEKSFLCGRYGYFLHFVGRIEEAIPRAAEEALQRLSHGLPLSAACQ